MSKRKQLVYEIGSAIFALTLLWSASALIYSHLKLGQLDSPVAEVAVLFSEDLQQEKALMEDVRIISAFLFVGCVVAGVAATVPYLKVRDNPVWEAKKGIGGALLGLPFGLLIYYLSSDLFPESLGLGAAVACLVVLILNTGSLLYVSELDGKIGSESGSGSYCPDCGNSVPGSASFCSDCGSEL